MDFVESPGISNTQVVVKIAISSIKMCWKKLWLPWWHQPLDGFEGPYQRAGNYLCLTL